MAFTDRTRNSGYQGLGAGRASAPPLQGAAVSQARGTRGYGRVRGQHPGHGGLGSACVPGAENTVPPQPPAFAPGPTGVSGSKALVPRDPTGSLHSSYPAGWPVGAQAPLGRGVQDTCPQRRRRHPFLLPRSHSHLGGGGRGLESRSSGRDTPAAVAPRGARRGPHLLDVHPHGPATPAEPGGPPVCFPATGRVRRLGEEGSQTPGATSQRFMNRWGLLRADGTADTPAG